MRLNDRVSAVYNAAASGNNPPTQQAKASFGELAAEADKQLDKLKNIQTADIPLFNKLIYDKRIPVIGVKD